MKLTLSVLTYKLQSTYTHTQTRIWDMQKGFLGFPPQFLQFAKDLSWSFNGHVKKYQFVFNIQTHTRFPLQVLQLIIQFATSLISIKT